MRWALGSLLLLAACLASGCADSEHELDSCRRPLIFGHRGTPIQAPENTLPAFEYAMRHGADGVEIDVQLTADGELVAFHDQNTRRATAGKTDRPISSLTLRELKRIPVCYRLCEDFPDATVPTLSEVVDALPQKTLLLFDLKAKGSDRAIVAFIRERGLAHRSFVSAFRLAPLRRVHRELPKIPLLFHMTHLDQLPEVRRDRGGIRYVRVPTNSTHETRAVDRILRSGLLPVVRNHRIRWGYGMSLVDEVAKSVAIRARRMPKACSAETL